MERVSWIHSLILGELGHQAQEVCLRWVIHTTGGEAKANKGIFRDSFPHKRREAAFRLRKLLLLISFQWLKLCWTTQDLKQQQQMWWISQVSPKEFTYYQSYLSRG